MPIEIQPQGTDISATPEQKTLYWYTHRFGKVTLTRGDDGFFRDEKGTIYPLTDTASIKDKTVRCGVGILSLPQHWQINVGCGPHDFAYSSPFYQFTHKRSDADKMLQMHVYLVEKGAWGELEALIVSNSAEEIARLLGGPFWENKATDDERAASPAELYEREQD